MGELDEIDRSLDSRDWQSISRANSREAGRVRTVQCGVGDLSKRYLRPPRKSASTAASSVGCCRRPPVGSSSQHNPVSVLVSMIASRARASLRSSTFLPRHPDQGGIPLAAPEPAFRRGAQGLRIGRGRHTGRFHVHGSMKSYSQAEAPPQNTFPWFRFVQAGRGCVVSLVGNGNRGKIHQRRVYQGEVMLERI
jgi:hypothetical protein